MFRLSALLALAFLALPAAGCRKHVPKTEPMLCWLTKPENTPIRGHDWVQLITRPRMWQQRVFAEQDCTGTTIWWEPPDESCLVKTPLLEQPKPTQLREGDVYERRVSNDVRLVWVVTHRFANGEGYGPIAVVRVHTTGLEVEAIGGLRMRTERVNLVLWHIGQRAVVVATGEACTDPRDPASCHRAANVLVHFNKVLFSPMLSFPDGRCIDEPWVELKREEDMPLESGWNRHFEIRSTVSHDSRYLVITEQVQIRDSQPNEPALPPREVRSIDTERFIHLDGPKLITRQHPLWPKVLPSAGSLELMGPDAESRD